MSFWDNVKKFAQPYSDDEYDDYEEPAETPAPARREKRRAAPAPVIEEEDEDDYGFAPVPAVSNTSVSTSGFSGQVLSMNNSASNKQEVVLFRPGSFNDITKAADDLCNNKAVVVNMEGVDKAMARRVVDFLSGSVYALQGTVTKIAQSAYLFCPNNMNVVGDLESLQVEAEQYI